jgi:hypothetical protein
MDHTKYGICKGIKFGFVGIQDMDQGVRGEVFPTIQGGTLGCKEEIHD